MYWADLEFPNIITKGDSIIYNFPFKAAVYIFDKNSRKTQGKEFSAAHIPQVVEGHDVGKKGTKASFELLYGDKYHQIDYDPHRNLYYMIYSQAKIDDEPLQKHLIVFNKRIEKIGEIDIPTDFSPNFAISRKGLLFRNVNEDSFDTLTLHVLNVEVEQQ